MRVFYEAFKSQDWHAEQPSDWLDAQPHVARRVKVTMTPAEWEALQARFNEQALFAWLTRVLGLQYTTAETHDLAAELAAYIRRAIAP